MRYIWHDKKWVPADEYRRPAKSGVYVIPDIEPYKSMETGERIAGRRQHRDHLRAHGLVEVGNERTERKRVPLPPVKNDIAQVMREKGILG